MSDKEALKLALEALEMCEVPWTGTLDHNLTEAITAIKQALAAPVQEPVAWMSREDYDDYLEESKVTSATVYNYQLDIPLYTTPPAASDLQAELDATNRQVEILSDALAESRREVAAKDEALKLALEVMHDQGDVGVDEWIAAEAAIKQALAAPTSAEYAMGYAEGFNDGCKPAPVQPVAWLTEERYAEIHTSKWSPKIKQVFSKEGILESQTVQYAPQSKAIPYPPAAQRQWAGLTDEDKAMCIQATVERGSADELIAAIEAKLKEKNT